MDEDIVYALQYQINSNIVMSAENLKQLKIKTSMLRRLRKEYESYQKETKTIQNKIHLYEETLTANQQDEQASIAIKKNKEFLAQSESVLSNVKQKLIEAFQGLAQFLSEKGEGEGVAGSEQKNLAQNLVLQVQTFLQNLQ